MGEKITQNGWSPRGSKIAAINNSRWQLLMSVGVRASSDNYFTGSGPTKSVHEKGPEQMGFTRRMVEGVIFLLLP